MNRSATGLIVVAILYQFSGCGRVSSTTASDPAFASLLIELRNKSEGAKVHICGEESAQELRKISDELEKTGPKGMRGTCKLYCAFEAVEGDWHEIRIQALRSDSFQYDHLEVVDPETGRIIIVATRGASGEVQGLHELSWFGCSFVLQDLSATTMPTTVPSFLASEPVISLQHGRHLLARVVDKGGGSSNTMPIMWANSNVDAKQ